MDKFKYYKVILHFEDKSKYTMYAKARHRKDMLDDVHAIINANLTVNGFKYYKIDKEIYDNVKCGNR